MSKVISFKASTGNNNSFICYGITAYSKKGLETSKWRMYFG